MAVVHAVAVGGGTLEYYIIIIAAANATQTDFQKVTRAYFWRVETFGGKSVYNRTGAPPPIYIFW